MNGFKFTPTISAMLICSGAALFGQSALAQGQQYQDQAYLERSEQQRRVQQSQRQAQQDERTVIGTVISQRDVLLEGHAEEPHHFVTVMDAQGDAVLVDLGARSQQTDLTHGDRIIAVGQVATINGQPVVYATYAGELAEVGRLQSEQQAMQQRQQQQQRGMAQGQQQARGERVIIGEVVDKSRVRLAGMPGGMHYLVKLQNPQGQTVVVDLGAAVEQMDIQRGDQLLAVGKSARINDRPVLYARFAGELAQTERGQEQAQLGQQQQRQRQLRLREQPSLQAQQRGTEQQTRQQAGRQGQQQGQQQAARQAQQQAQQQAGRQAQQQGQQQPEQAERTVVGQVVDQREVAIAGADTKHKFVKLRNDQGHTIVVDLGAATQAMDLQQGDRVIAVGKSARVNDLPVLYAQYAGQLESVGRTGLQNQQQQGRQSQQQQGQQQGQEQQGQQQQ